MVRGGIYLNKLFLSMSGEESILAFPEVQGQKACRNDNAKHKLKDVEGDTLRQPARKASSNDALFKQVLPYLSQAKGHILRTQALCSGSEEISAYLDPKAFTILSRSLSLS